MNDAIELFSARVCPYAHRSRLVLMEKGIDFTLTEIDLSNKSERFLQVSAYGKVPALLHNEVEIYESAIINEYLEEVFPDPVLLPRSAARRAYARIWIDYCNSRFTTDSYTLLKNRDQDKMERLVTVVHDHFRIIENRALAKLSGDGPYWFGRAPSLVDMAYYPHFERFPAWEYYRGLTIPADCPRLLNWVQAMGNRDSVRAIINSPEYYIERYKSYAT